LRELRRKRISPVGIEPREILGLRWRFDGGTDYEPDLHGVGVIEDLPNSIGVARNGFERFERQRLVADVDSPSSLENDVELHLLAMPMA
jgi:hypothetical protein